MEKDGEKKKDVKSAGGQWMLKKDMAGKSQDGDIGYFTKSLRVAIREAQLQKNKQTQKKKTLLICIIRFKCSLYLAFTRSKICKEIAV